MSYNKILKLACEFDKLTKKADALPTGAEAGTVRNAIKATLVNYKMPGSGKTFQLSGDVDKLNKSLFEIATLYNSAIEAAGGSDFIESLPYGAIGASYSANLENGKWTVQATGFVPTSNHDILNKALTSLIVPIGESVKKELFAWLSKFSPTGENGTSVDGKQISGNLNPA